MNRRRGFTLIELMVVGGVMGILTAIMVPVLAKSKAAGVVAACASNLKQQGELFGLYASANGDKLPMFNGTVSSGLIYNKQPVLNSSGYWLHDEPIDFGDTLLGLAPGNGAEGQSAASRIFYCPSKSTAIAQGLWADQEYMAGGYRCMGYAYMNDRTGESTDGTTDGKLPNLPKQTRYSPTDQLARPTVSPLTYHQQFLSTENPTQTELALDEIMSLWDAPPTDFSRPLVDGTGQAVSGIIDPYGTSHLIGSFNAGANVLAFDGHVEWRVLNPGSVSKPGYYAVVDMPSRPADGSSGQGIYYWIPSPK